MQMQVTQFYTVINEPYIQLPNYEELKGHRVKIVVGLDINENNNTQQKLEAFNNILKSATTHNSFLDNFDKNDNKILQKIKGMME